MRVTFLAKSFFNQRLVEKGEAVHVPDATPLSAHMVADPVEVPAAPPPPVVEPQPAPQPAPAPPATP